MSTNYPNSKQTFTDYTAGAVITSVDLNAVRDTVEAVEDKVGVNGSADVNSLTYKVENASSVNPGHKHGISGLSATGTASSTTFLRGDNTWAIPPTTTDASTTAKGVSKLSVAPVTANDPIAVGTNDTRLSNASYSNKGIVQLDTSANTSGLNVTNGVISVNAGTNANQIVKLEGSGRLPAVDGSLLTVLPAGYTKETKIYDVYQSSGTTINSYSSQHTITLPSIAVGKRYKIEIAGSVFNSSNWSAPYFNIILGGINIFNFNPFNTNAQNNIGIQFILEIGSNYTERIGAYSITDYLGTSAVLKDRVSGTVANTSMVINTTHHSGMGIPPLFNITIYNLV